LDFTPGALRPVCVTAATTSAGYIMAKFRRAKLPQFDLVRGDPKENLRNLQQRPEAPTDPTSQKIWRLLKLGYSVPKLIDALKLLARCSWSTSVIEQGHAFTSSLVRGHRMYGSRTVQDRTLVIAARALFSISGFISDELMMNSSQNSNRRSLSRRRAFSVIRSYFSIFDVNSIFHFFFIFSSNSCAFGATI
jgi:hypothetical protein